MAVPSPVPAVAAELTPVAPQDRVQLLDVFRGFCLFGVLWSNLNDWYTVAKPVTALDHALQWTQNWLVESRFYPMLGFLFGIGFAIQLKRAAQRGQDVRNLFLRRMLVLLGFGIIHATLIWHGDILVGYALAGFALLFFRRLSSRKLLIALPVLWLLYPYLVFHLAPLLNIHLPNNDAMREMNKQAYQAQMHGTWAQTVVAGSRQFSGKLVRSLVGGGSASFLGLFILGLWAVRVDMIARLTRRRAHILWASLGALLCWAGLQYVQLNLGHWWPAPGVSAVATWHELPFWWPPRGIVINFIGQLTTWTNAVVYALPFALAMSFSAVAKRLQPLAAVGRMTLTTYLVQSLVCTTLFYNWGFGLMNRINLSGILVCHRRCKNPHNAGRKFPSPREVVYTRISSARGRCGDLLRGHDVQGLEELKRQGLSIQSISNLTGYDRKTVRKYLLRPEGVPAYSPRKMQPGKLEAFKPYLEERLQAGVWNGSVLLRELRERGYGGGYTILTDWLRPQRESARVVAVRRFETPPGKQGQVDWGHLGTIEMEGRERQLWGFTLTLGYSRMMMAEAALDQKLGTLLRMHEEAFRQLGGVPEEILYDRMKTVWQETDERGEIVWNPVFHDFARYWGFTPRLCRPYRAQTKGKVEAGVKYVRRNFLCGLQGREPACLNDLNAQLRAWVWEVANQRVHGTTQQAIAARRDAEEFSLQPMAGRPCYPYCDDELRKVARDAYVCWQGSRYSVPWKYAGKEVWVRDCDSEIEIRYGAEKIAWHTRALRKHLIVTQAQHHEGIPLDPRQTRHKTVIHIREAAPVVEVRPLAAYESAAAGGER